jgi:hypothetical protein
MPNRAWASPAGGKAGQYEQEVDAVSRWREVIDNLLADLEMETPGAEGFRLNIDHKMWEAEKKVAQADPIKFSETRADRIRELQTELRRKFSGDPSNQIWKEALMLLGNPRLRVPEDQRPA